jgi:nucleotidyltransferase/DNA polymerase involved in DNA repair
MTNASKTIRKNSKEFNAVLACTKLKKYSLDNCFIAEDITVVYPITNPDRIVLRNGIYTIRIHSNLWYTTTVEAVNN